MPFRSLSDFLTALQDDGALVRIETPVDPVFELAELTRQVAHSSDGGPALLFADVRGSELPVVSNLLGTDRRLCRALDVPDFDAAADRLAAALRPADVEGWMQSLRRFPQFSQLSGCAPRIVKTGSCQQIVYLGSDVALGDLPVPHCWPAESGRNITAGQVFIKDLETGSRHVGGYTLHVLDNRSMAIVWSDQDEGHHIAETYRTSGQQMPLAVALGGDPLLNYVARAPVPAGIDSILCTGLLREEGVELVRGRTVELEVPAEADVIIEGYLDFEQPSPGKLTVATAFGHVMEVEQPPVMQVTAVTRRANPVIPATVPSLPPSEEHVQRKLSERLALPLLRMQIPEIRDISFPLSGSVQQILFVSLHKKFPRHARQVVTALSGLRCCRGTKIIVAVDAEIDVGDQRQVWLATSSNVDPGRDVFTLEGPGVAADPAAPSPGLGSLLGIDATRKLPAEHQSREWPPVAAAHDDVRRRVAEMRDKLGFDVAGVAVPSSR